MAWIAARAAMGGCSSLPALLGVGGNPCDDEEE
jgi:hypothetical protein